MKEILLTKGMIALVDDDVFEELSKTSWYAHTSPGSRSGVFYAARGTMKNYKNKLYLMHRQILGITDSSISVDHIDGDGLNNQKSNLRKCSHSQNMCNRIKRNNASSKYKGVSWNKERNSWDVRCVYNGKRLNATRCKDEIEAALIYNVIASFAHREFAKLNTI